MGSVVPLHPLPAHVEADRLASTAPRGIPFSAAALGAQARLLSLLGSDAPLPVLLDALARYVETWTPSMYCSILIRDPLRNVLVPGAAPSLPREYVDQLGEVPIGEEIGCCGTAAHRGEPVTVPDMRASPLWTRFLHLTDPYGLRACWSVPFLDDSGQTLGTLAMYYLHPRDPSAEEHEVIRFAAALARMVVLQHRRLAALWASNEQVSLERSVIEAAEEEREHLALDLHDGVCQRLVGIEWLLAAEVSRAEPDRQPALRALQDLVAGVQRDVGSLATWILPLTRHSDGLAGALQQIAQDVRERHFVDCRAIAPPGDGPDVASARRDSLLRIVQGCISHVLDSGPCQALSIVLDFDAAAVSIEVCVEGPALGNGDPAPLRAARYRALQVGATIVFEPRGSAGSRMRATLPRN